MSIDLDTASITAAGTAVATVILSIAPLIRAAHELPPRAEEVELAKVK